MFLGLILPQGRKEGRKEGFKLCESKTKHVFIHPPVGGFKSFSQVFRI
jgi:hypothetical protein